MKKELLEWNVIHKKNATLDNILNEKSKNTKRMRSLSLDIVTNYKSIIKMDEEIKKLSAINENFFRLENCFENKLNNDELNMLINDLINNKDYSVLSDMIITRIKLNDSLKERILDILINNSRNRELEGIKYYIDILDEQVRDKLNAYFVLNTLEKSAKELYDDWD